LNLTRLLRESAAWAAAPEEEVPCKYFSGAIREPIHLANLLAKVHTHCDAEEPSKAASDSGHELYAEHASKSKPKTRNDSTWHSVLLAVLAEIVCRPDVHATKGANTDPHVIMEAMIQRTQSIGEISSIVVPLGLRWKVSTEFLPNESHNGYQDGIRNETLHSNDKTTPPRLPPTNILVHVNAHFSP
jgi:hypothetical protein